MTAFSFAGDWAPYIVVLVLGCLPNEIWRIAGVFAAKSLREDAEILILVRYIAVALVSAVVAQLVFMPPAPLARVPDWARLSAFCVGFACYWALGRSVLAGVVAGTSMLVVLALKFASVA